MLALAIDWRVNRFLLAKGGHCQWRPKGGAVNFPCKLIGHTLRFVLGGRTVERGALLDCCGSLEFSVGFFHHFCVGHQRGTGASWTNTRKSDGAASAASGFGAKRPEGKVMARVPSHDFHCSERAAKDQ